MLIQMNRNLYHDSLSVVECSGTSWSVLERRGVREWQKWNGKTDAFSGRNPYIALKSYLSRSGGMVDAPVSKTGGGNPVSVRIRPSAPLFRYRIGPWSKPGALSFLKCSRLSKKCLLAP